MERMYGLRADEGMCVGPCWKLWTELMLVAFVIFAVVMGWDLDGGIYWRFMDRQVEKLKQEDAEKAAKETAPVEDKTVLEIDGRGKRSEQRVRYIALDRMWLVVSKTLVTTKSTNYGKGRPVSEATVLLPEDREAYYFTPSRNSWYSVCESTW
jgi:hypothetical protein